MRLWPAEYEELRAEMDDHSVGLRFEEAGRFRDLIAKLDRTTSRSRPVAGIRGDCDLVGLARDGEDASAVVMRVRGGHILTTHHFLLADRLDRGLETFMAQLLREAAALTSEPSLKRYLEARADAFFSDDYYESDKAWMDLDSSVEVTIGPYEVYEDHRYGYKAAFECFICVAQPEDSARLEVRDPGELPGPGGRRRCCRHLLSGTSSSSALDQSERRNASSYWNVWNSSPRSAC